MARRRTSRELDDADFATAVITLYSAALSNKLHTYSGNRNRDVRKVAFGLTTLRQLVDREMRAGNPDPGLPLLEAQQIIDALTTGRNHPVWHHVRGLKTGSFRPQRSAPNSVERLGRIAVVGLVGAYAQTANVSQRAAREVVVQVCRFKDFQFKTEQLKGWDRTFREQKEQGPEAFASHFVERAATLNEPATPEDRVLRVGRDTIWRLWGVASVTEPR